MFYFFITIFVIHIHFFIFVTNTLLITTFIVSTSVNLTDLLNITNIEKT